MHPANPVLITGCTLSVPSELKAVHGDLWMIGSSFVFNAVVHGFDTDWLHGEEMLEITGRYRKILRIIEGAPYFDRRGVIVVDRLHATLSAAAREYLKDHPFFNHQEK